jgi:hypothetical protein
MKFTILFQAEFHYNMLEYDLDSSGSDRVMMHGYFLGFLFESVKQNLTTKKSMWQGFINIWDYIARCLRENRAPNKDDVLFVREYEPSEWPPVTKCYLQRRGTIAAVTTMVFEMAM